MQKLKVLDLFSGIGGFSLGLERTGGFETVAFCEIDQFCQKVLKKHWPDVPIYNDVRTMNYDGEVDVVTGGFPCQDISIAGNKAGIQFDKSTGQATTRSGLFWENLRIFCMVRAKYWLMENVAEIYNGHLGNILGALAESGNDAEWDCLSSARLGRRHLRERFYALAYPGSVRLQGGEFGVPQDKGQGNIYASLFPPLPLRTPVDENELPKPYVVGKADGIPNRAHRIKALGNTIDPELPEMIGYAILKTTTQQNNQESPTNDRQKE